ncbi:MAG TPA: hypothetical protein VL087_07435 [Nitrospirota bacterium]|nr:hypothetical protein [Nitrospirota bacterium]
MKTTAGLWIDHKKAVIVLVTGKGEEIKLMISHAEKQPGRYGGVRTTAPYEKQILADDSLERTFVGHLNIYYDAVISCVRDAAAIMIFGPGEAKGELKKRMKKNKLSGRIVSIETADKMTHRQIAAKVREYFKK